MNHVARCAVILAAFVFLYNCASVPDTSGNGNKLALIGGARIVAAEKRVNPSLENTVGLWTFDDSSSAVGSSLEIPVPKGARAQAGSAPSLEMGPNDSFTITALLKTSTTKGDWKRIVTKRGGATKGIGSNWYSMAIKNNTLCLELSDGINYLAASGATFLADGLWHHVAAVRDRLAGKIFLYVDGNSDGILSDPTGDLSNGEIFEIGNWDEEAYQGTNFVGLIDEVCIAKIALSPAEVEIEARRILHVSD